MGKKPVKRGGTRMQELGKRRLAFWFNPPEIKKAKRLARRFKLSLSKLVRGLVVTGLENPPAELVSG